MKQQQLFENESGLSQCAVTSSAALSDCQKYRYCLSRIWDESRPKVLFIMLNPSTADANNDDPTIRRCIGFAKMWGYGGLYVVNLFAYRATEPSELLKVHDPIGLDNFQWLCKVDMLVDAAVCAWGNGTLVKRLLKDRPEYKPLKWIKKPLYYLELSKDGTPKHPLYLLKTVQMNRYEVGRPHYW